MKSRVNGLLLAYALVTSTIAASFAVNQAVSAPEKTSFEEIDVRRINLREEDGTLRMVISNTQRFPGIIFKGKEQPHPNRRTAGMLFFNEEGTENGGLTFGGRTDENGKVTSGGHLSFDQYEQDQVVQITQHENDGQRYAALVVSDRPDRSLDFAALAKITAMPEGAQKQAAMKELEDMFGGKPRLQIGKWRDRSSALYLHDAAGRPRMVLQVTAEGAASIQFLDENMKVVRTVTPDAAAEDQDK